MQEKTIILSSPQADLIESTQQLNLFLAGQGSGKTHCAGTLSSIFISQFPNVRGLICANTYGQLNKSTMFRIRECWKESGITEYNKKTGNGNYVVGIIPPEYFNTKRHNFDKYDNIISFSNGMVIFIGSLDNYKAIDGMEVGWAILDETKDTKEMAVKEVILGRVRQEGLYIKDGELSDSGEPFNPVYIFTSPAKVQWLNEFFELDLFEDEIKRKIFSKDEYFIKDHSNKRIIISSTFHNKDNLPDNFIENLILNLTTYLQDMLIYGSPFSKSGGEFYPCFDRSLHVFKQDKIGDGYDSSLPIWVSFDENVNPYMPSGLWQGKDSKVWKIEEIDLEAPNNKLAKVCDKIIARYQNHTHGMFIAGDTTSKKNDAKLEEGYNFFKLAKRYLAQFHPVIKIPRKNPSVIMRKNFINTVFEKNLYGIEISIGSKCTNTIADYTYLKEDGDGKKLKEKVKDPNTGITYEKYGHDIDLDEYFICEFFKKDFARYSGKRGLSSYG